MRAVALSLEGEEATSSGMRLTRFFSGMRTVEDRLLLCRAAVQACSRAESDAKVLEYGENAQDHHRIVSFFLNKVLYDMSKDLRILNKN